MEHHLNNFFWSPTGSGSSNSNSSADTNESDEFPSDPDAEALHVGDDLDEDFDPFDDNLPPFSAAYMRTLLKSVNEKWDKEPCHLQERVAKVQFMPDHNLVTVTYFSEDEGSREDEPESAQPLLIVPGSTDLTSDHVSRSDQDDLTKVPEQDGTKDVQISAEILPSSGGSTSGSSSSNLIDLHTEAAILPKSESVIWTEVEKAELTPTPSTEAAEAFLSSAEITQANNAWLDAKLAMALRPAHTNSQDFRLDSLSSSSSEETSLVPSIEPVQTETESDPQLTRTSSADLELDTKSSQEKSNVVKGLEVTGVKLPVKQESELMAQPPAPAVQVTKVKVRRSVSLKTLVEPSHSVRRQSEGSAQVRRTSPVQTTSNLSLTSSGSADDAHFDAVIQAVFNKKTLVSLNSLMEPKRLAQVKVQILRRGITNSMVSNLFHPDIVSLLFDDDQRTPRPTVTESKWATRPLFRQDLDYVPLIASSKDGLASPSKPRISVSSGSLKGLGKKQRVAGEGLKLKGSSTGRSLSAKEKVSKLRTTIAKLSPRRPATTGSTTNNRINYLSRSGESYSGTNGVNRVSGTNYSGIDLTLNAALDSIKQADEKKAKLQDFHSWLDRKKKPSPRKPSSALSGDSDRWLQRMKLQTKKAEDEILAKIRTDNNPRMMDAYRAYRFGGPHSIGTSNPTPLKKVTGKIVKFTQA